ncbi:MAG: BTAD domain-containing putative transcriptional regulator [Actinomycetota bacterium]
MGDHDTTRDDTSPTWRLLAAQPVAIDGVPVDLAARPRAVAAALLLSPNEVVSTDRLVERIWGEAPPKTARNSVARFVADTRKAIGPLAERIHTEDGGYRIEVGAHELDVDRARRLFAAAEASSGETAVTGARAGLALFGSTGVAVLDLHDTTAEVRSHDELRVGLLRILGERLLEAGRHVEAVPELEQGVDAFPYHEQLWGLLMQALYRSNRQTDALRTYQRLVDVLDEIGLQPAPDIRRLEAEILAQQEVGGGAASNGAVAAGTGRRDAAARAGQHGLPQPRTSLVGRGDDVATILAALESTRVVTLVGIGGIGKTRTAIAVANELAADGTVAVHTIALRSIDDEARLSPTLAAVLGAYGDVVDESDPGAIVRNIGAQPMVIVLDNCEHLVEGVGRLADAILDGAPNARVLLTSRVPVGLDGEFVYRLAPLALPDGADDTADSPAVTLLVDRARAQGTLETTDETRRDLAELSRALHGLPLAIELAAVQLAHQTPAELRDRIEAVGISELTDTRGNALLDEVLDWAWQSLPAAQQDLLAGSTVFGGSWSLDAAEAVAGRPVSADLAALVRGGLVVMNPIGGRARYELLEPIREWAIHRLADERRTEHREALAVWLEALVGRWTYNERDNLAEPARELAPEHDNITAALEHLDETEQAERTLWLAVGVSPYWNHYGFTAEAIRWLTPLANDASLPSEALSAAAACLAGAWSTLGNGETFLEWGLRCLELAGDDALPWVPHIAGLLGSHRLTHDFPGDIESLFARSVDAVRDPLADAVSATWRALANLMMLRSEESLALAREALAHCDRPGRILLFAEQIEAAALLFLGRDDEALESCRGWRSDQSTDEWHFTLEAVRATIRAHAGEADEATSDLEAAIERLPAASVVGRAADFQFAFGMLAHYRGDVALADELLATEAPLQPLILLIAVRNHALRNDHFTPEGWIASHVEFASRLPDPDLTGAPAGKLAGVAMRSDASAWTRRHDTSRFDTN